MPKPRARSQTNHNTVINEEFTVKTRLSFAALGCAALLCACVVEPARPPEPPPRVEVVPPAPQPGYHWVKGHYRWEGNHWDWVPGHWAAAW